MRRIFALFVLLAAGRAQAQLTPSERQGLVDTLYIGNLTPRDLDSERRSSAAVQTFQFLQQAVGQPLLAADNAMALHALAGTRSIAQLIDHLRANILGNPTVHPEAPTFDVVVPDEVPEPARPSIKRLVTSLIVANDCIRRATLNLSAEERRLLIEALPRLAVSQPSIKFDFVKQPMPDRAAILAIVSKTDLGWLRQGARFLAQDVQEEIAKLKEIAPQIVLEKPLRTTINGFVVELGGQGSDLHDSTDAVLCIDFGGNDHYTGRYGAGVGYASVLIDLGGDDSYDVPDLSIGAGVVGIGLAYDLGGNDVFRGKSICFGSGIAGVGTLLKDGGDDLYQSTSLSQGFGMLGFGILLDTKGDDYYSLGYMGQGAGRSTGIGWLIDKAGADVYRCGGLVPNPLLPGSHLSMGQGYGASDYDLAGGMGLLTDLGGDDAYLGEVACQAVGRDRGFGSLYDAAGTDSYSATNEAQASASRLGAAYLFDLDGDDTYAVRQGNCHAFGHDYGVAFLLDRSGGDIYSARDSRPATGNANGLAIFLDAGGDDRYFGPPAVGNAARGTGSLAVFCDLGGMDVYGEGLADGTAVAGPKWFAAYDAVSYTPNKPLDPAVSTDAPKPGSKQIRPDEEMDTLLRRAADGAPDDASKALDELIAIGEPAVKWFVEKRLARCTASQTRALGWVTREIGGGAKLLVVKQIEAKEDAMARNAIFVCIEGDIQEASPALAGALKRPALATAAARAAGALQARDCVPVLLDLVASPDGGLKQTAVISLAQIGDARAYPKLEPMLNSDDLVLRKAAVDMVARIPDRALVTAKTMLASPGERTARTGLEILAALGSVEAMEMAGKALEDPRKGVKIQALLTVDGRCPKEFRPLLLELRKSSDPLIAAVANRVDGGR